MKIPSKQFRFIIECSTVDISDLIPTGCSNCIRLRIQNEDGAAAHPGGGHVCTLWATHGQ